MSRFFDGSSDSDHSDQSDEDIQQEIAAPVASRFDFESSSEDEEKRVIKSEKDKRFDEMQSCIKVTKNHVKIGDWAAVSKDFDLLNKQLQSAKNVVAKEGIPNFYFTQMLTLEKNVAEAYEQMKDDKKNSRKKFNATNARALSTLKQKLKKNRVKYQAQYEDFENANPKLKRKQTNEQEEEEENEENGANQEEQEPEEEPEEEEEEPAPKPTKKVSKKKPVQVEEEEDEQDDAEDEEEDEQDDDEQEEKEDDDDDDFELSTEITRDFWVKKEPKEQKVVEKPKPPKVPKQPKVKKDQERQEPARRNLLQASDITPEVVGQRLNEIITKFGRRNTDRYGMIEDLKLLASKAQDPAALLKIKITLCSAFFDFSVNAAYLPLENWRAIAGIISDIIDMLLHNSSVKLSEDAKDVEETLFNDDKDAEKPKVSYVLGSVFSYVNRLFNEYRKCLQNIDAHSPEYVIRLQDETVLVKLMSKTQDYYSKLGKNDFLSEVGCLKLELLHYKHRPELDAQAVDEKKGAQDNDVEKLALFLYKSVDERIRIRAVLFHVYYLALHNYLNEARDRLLMSHIQDFVNDTDIETRILFNRVMAQMGLCAFRTGDVKQALTCLSELHYTNKVKELLGQGINQRWNADRDLDKENLEKLRQYPFHMHINIDTLDGVYLTSALLVEVPNIVLFGPSNKSKETRSFRRFFDSHSRQAFNGPPENTREIVMAASKALLKSNWKKTQELLWRLKMWSTFSRADAIKAQFSVKIREVALKTFLLAYGPHYASVNLDLLSSLFDMPVSQVHKAVCKMIVDDQLQGSLDQPNKTVVMNASETSSLQKAALAFPEKVTAFIEQNEKALEIRGGYLYTKPDKKGWTDFSRGRSNR